MAEMLSPAEQTAIVEANLKFARHIVRCRAPFLSPASPDYDDAVGAATVGLMLAAGKFDPSAGTAFTIFAGWRCRSQLASYLRSRRRRGLRSPPPGPVPMVSLNYERGPNGLTLAEMLPGRPEHDPDAKPDVASLLGGLPDRERQLIAALYMEEIDSGTLARQMRVSKERLGQLRRRALERLRERVGLA
jgi:RNA polymerase sigma factor (sigma-70 family)